jgi:hypothetical protein
MPLLSSFLVGVAVKLGVGLVSSIARRAADASAATSGTAEPPPFARVLESRIPGVPGTGDVAAPASASPAWGPGAAAGVRPPSDVAGRLTAEAAFRGFGGPPGARAGYDAEAP